jgi:hypothetical protein
MVPYAIFTDDKARKLPNCALMNQINVYIFLIMIPFDKC